MLKLSCRRGSSPIACSFWAREDVFTQPGPIVLKTFARTKGPQDQFFGCETNRRAPRSSSSSSGSRLGQVDIADHGKAPIIQDEPLIVQSGCYRCVVLIGLLIPNDNKFDGVCLHPGFQQRDILHNRVILAVTSSSPQSLRMANSSGRAHPIVAHRSWDRWKS